MGPLVIGVPILLLGIGCACVGQREKTSLPESIALSMLAVVLCFIGGFFTIGGLLFP